MTRALASSRGPLAVLGDPERESAARWGTCGMLGMPIMSWHLLGEEARETADGVEAMLTGTAATIDELRRDTVLIDTIDRALRDGTGPAGVLAALVQLAIDRDPPTPPPARADRGDALCEVALDLAGGREEYAVRLLGDDDARVLLGWIAERLPVSVRPRLVGVVRAACARALLSVELVREAAVEHVVSRELEAETDRLRAELEEPQRERARALVALAAERRAALAAEIDGAR